MIARQKVSLLERVSKLGDVLDEQINSEHGMPEWKAHLLNERLTTIEVLMGQMDRRHLSR